MSNPAVPRRPNVFELEKQLALLQQHVNVLSQTMMMIPPHPPIPSPQSAFVRPMIPFHGGVPPPHPQPYPQRSMHATVPLQQAIPSSHHRGSALPPSNRGRFQTRRYMPTRDVNPVRHAQEDDREISPYMLSDLLQEGEEVVMRIIIGAEEDGYPRFASAILVYDGTRLAVRECELVPGLVGQTSEKAGALLYKFMDGLFDMGQLRRKFSIAPWKLCYVKRDGEFISLNKLRKKGSPQQQAYASSSE